MNFYGLGVLAGLVLGILIIVVLLIFTKKNHSLRGKYDERQLIAQGKGYKYAFFTMLIYFSGLVVLDLTETFAVNAILLLPGVLLGVIVYVNYAIFSDAYFALNEAANRCFVIFIIAAAMNLLSGIIQIVDDIKLNNPIDEVNLYSIFVGVTVLEVLIVLVIKKVIDRKADREE